MEQNSAFDQSRGHGERKATDNISWEQIGRWYRTFKLLMCRGRVIKISDPERRPFHRMKRYTVRGKD